MRMQLHRILNFIWYQKHPARWLLWPLSLLYQVVGGVRRRYLQCFKQQAVDVPIIVVGNLTVGGVGKTPLVIALAHAFQARGLRVGIVSRGYGAKIKQFPHEVALTDAAEQVGDEPLLLAKRTKCPVVIAPKRVAAVRHLIDHHHSQIIISDDGLQHYRMGRTIEIVVVDGTRGFGNGLCLPAGPMRETVRRTSEVDFVITNGSTKQDIAHRYHYAMELIPGDLMRVLDNRLTEWHEIKCRVAAVAGIGYPERFFETLVSCGVLFEPYPFPDHHQFKPTDFSMPQKAVVMTEKDAVKCLSFATETMYFLPVEAKLSESFWQALWARIKSE